MKPYSKMSEAELRKIFDAAVGTLSHEERSVLYGLTFEELGVIGRLNAIFQKAGYRHGFYRASRYCLVLCCISLSISLIDLLRSFHFFKGTP